MSTPNTHFGPELISEYLKNCRTVHFIGVGGIMMSSLAIITKLRGYNVTGSDRTQTEITDKVSSYGIEVHYGHDASLVSNCGAVIYTVAVDPENPEYAEAVKKNIPLISRADYLGYLMTAYKNRIGISGMHGKSTCTSMCSQIFIGAETNPTVISGAETKLMNGAYLIGGLENFIFEACEYQDSFLDFRPTVAVLLNAEMEHVDYFKSMEHIRRSFGRFASLTGDSGTAIVNADCENVLTAVKDYEGKKLTFGINSESADYRAVNITFNYGKPSFDILKGGESFIHVDLSVIGRHNVLNALAAAAASDVCGISPDKIVEGLAKFPGAKRRMEYKGLLNGAEVFDDYGHHPTEVKATLDAAKKTGHKRLICVFQSHTYSRTAELFDRFVTTFNSADKVIFADIYAAREANTYGITPEKLASAIGEKAKYGGSLEDIAKELKTVSEPGDMIVVMGAGNIYKLFDMLDLK